MSGVKRFNKTAYWPSMYDDSAMSIILNKMAWIEADMSFHYICSGNDEKIMFIFCLQGSGKIFYHDKRLLIKKGSAFWVNTKDGFEIFSESDELRLIWIQTSGNFVKQLFVHQLNDKGNVVSFGPEIISLCNEIYELARQGWSYEREIKISCYLYSMCGMLMVYKEKNTVLEPAVEYIQNNYMYDIKMNELAGMCFLGSSQFIKRFKETYLVTPKEFLTNIRIEKAKSLLNGTKKSVAEIAASAGYTDPSYFTRIFRLKTGKTPLEYKKELF